VAGEADFYAHDTAKPIEIVVRFGGLGSEAEAEFSKYVRHGRLSVTRRFRYDGSRVTDAFHGVAAQSPDFAEIRALQGRERIDAYRTRREEFGLQTATSVAAVDRELVNWETANPDRLELAEDDGFFGYRNVAAGKLDKYIDFVLVPAVRDAAADAGDGRDSTLRRLVDAVIRRSVALDAPLAQLRQNLTRDYDALLRLPELALGDLQDRMSRAIQGFAPGTTVDLSWGSAPDVRIPEPSPVARLTDDGFTGDVASKGHGLQRAYLMAALQALAEVEASRAAGSRGDATPSSPRGLLLAVEEPELFQHPAQARFIARTFESLTSDSAAQVCVLACTHSPIFVDVRSFNSLRRVQKQHTAAGTVVVVKWASLDQVAQRLKDVHQRSTPFSGAGLRPGLVALMNPYVNEALFADFVVLVEGEEDKALLEAALPRQQGWGEVQTRAFAVVPVGGKTLLDKMSAILSLLEIPHFLVFDRDGEGRDRSDDAGRWNQVLGRLAGVTEPEAMPATSCGDHYAVFAPTVTEVVKQEMGADRWFELRDTVCRELGIDVHQNVTKKADVVTRMLEHAAGEGMSSPSLDAAARAIVSAVAHDLTGPTSSIADQDQDQDPGRA
jgi:putative ATP-dependent endonuclease of OLD family